MSHSTELQAFTDWKERFNTKKAWSYRNKIWRLEPVELNLCALDDIKLKTRDLSYLKQNILLACYEAYHCPDPTTDQLSKARANWVNGFNALRDQQKLVSEIINFIDSYPGFASNALSFGLSSETSSPRGHDSRDMNSLREQLFSYEQGLSIIGNADHYSHLDITLDSQFGPFIFPHLIKGARGRMMPDVKIVGLIFHLVYIFRYFSIYETIEHTTTRFINGRLVISGQMLMHGKPSFNHVAAFVNATFNTKFSARSVKEKLNDLFTPGIIKKNVHRSGKQKINAQRREIFWAGWPSA